MAKRWKPNVTVAAIIGRELDGVPQFLLVEEHTRDGLRLNNPAGHLEPGESPQQAVARETREETARAFRPTALVGIYLARSHAGGGEPERAAAEDGKVELRDTTYLRLAFAGEVGEADAMQPLDDGIVGTVWMTLSELRASKARHRSPLVLRCIEDFVAGRRFPLDLVHTDASVGAPHREGG